SPPTVPPGPTEDAHAATRATGNATIHGHASFIKPTPPRSILGGARSTPAVAVESYRFVFTLYATPLSANGRKALAVCRHLGLKPETRLVNVYKGEGRTPEYLAVNPLGKVP